MKSASKAVHSGIYPYCSLPSQQSFQTFHAIIQKHTAFMPKLLISCTGILSAVGSLRATSQNYTFFLTWTAPFTLDIAGVDPDITYCVGVVNSTSSTLHSQCGITETEYEYPIPPDSACHMYMFTVTPVNPVGNGQPSTQEGIMPTVIEMIRLSFHSSTSTTSE